MEDARRDVDPPTGTPEPAPADPVPEGPAAEAPAGVASHAADQLVATLYADLRALARARMRQVPPGNTLQATALVHQAYLRLVGSGDPGWNSPGHFFASAAQAMRQILVEQARRKSAVKHGGGQERVDLDAAEPVIQPPSDDILAVDRALDRLQKEDPRRAQIVLLRYFAGLDREETAAALDISVRTVDREWQTIVAWLHKQITGQQRPAEPEA